MRVPLHVLAEMIAAHEAILAHGAHELLLARVCAIVARELVGAGERLVARVPLAYVGTFARVHAYVRLEMRALEVALVAVGIRAHVVARLGRRRRGRRRRR